MKKRNKQDMNSLSDLFGEFASTLNKITTKYDHTFAASGSVDDDSELTYDEYRSAKTGGPSHSEPDDCYNAYQQGFRNGVDSVVDDMIPGICTPTIREKILNRMYNGIESMDPSDIAIFAQTLLTLAQSDAVNASIPGSGGDDSEDHS